MAAKKPMINNKEFQESIINVCGVRRMAGIDSNFKALVKLNLLERLELNAEELVQLEKNAKTFSLIELGFDGKQKLSVKEIKKFKEVSHNFTLIAVDKLLLSNRALSVKYYKHYRNIGQIALRLANHLLNHHWFSGYDEHRKDEMRGEGLVQMTRAIDKYDYEQAFNPHAYFTTVCWNSYRQYVKKNRKIDEKVVRLEMIDNYWSEE